MENLYRIEELGTSGWEVVESTAVKMTQEKTKEMYEYLLRQGCNPERLRVVREQ